MKIKVLLNIGRVDAKAMEVPMLEEGTHDVSDKIGKKLVERGWAELVGSTRGEAKEAPLRTEAKSPALQAGK